MSKQVTVRATAGFILRGRAPVEIGEVVELHESLAREMIHANKAEPYTAAPETPSNKPVDAAEPAPKAASENSSAAGGKKR